MSIFSINNKFKKSLFIITIIFCVLFIITFIFFLRWNDKVEQINKSISICNSKLYTDYLSYSPNQQLNNNKDLEVNNALTLICYNKIIQSQNSLNTLSLSIITETLSLCSIIFGFIFISFISYIKYYEKKK